MDFPNYLQNIGSRRAGLQNMFFHLTRKYWLDALIVVLAVYVFQIKGNIQISIGSNMGSNHEVPLVNWSAQTAALYQKPTEPEPTPEPQVSKVNDLETNPGSPITPSEKPKSELLAVETASDVAQNLANNYNNLSFVLDPGMAARKNVPAEVVKIKQDKCMKYVQKFVKVAQEEKRKYGIPASVTLAQGLLESNAGESRLTRNNNNHFGIKCFSKKCRKGHCSNFTDDTHKDFFRKYPDGVDSYREHSRFLQQSRYAGLRKFSSLDYKNWSLGLKKAGYATDPKYAQKLIKIIEVLKLHRFDEES